MHEVEEQQDWETLYCALTLKSVLVSMARKGENKMLLLVVSNKEGGKKMCNNWKEV